MNLSKIFWVGLGILFVGSAWYFSRPKEDLHIEINKSLEVHSEVIIRHIDHALAASKRFAKSASRLQLDIDRKKIRNPVPGAGPERAITLGEIVDLTASFELKSKYGTFSGNFEPDILLQILYEPFGFFDYYVVVRDFSENTSTSGEKNTKALLRIYPTDTHGRAIPESGGLSETIFRAKIAKYLIDAFANPLDGTVACSVKLCLSELSDSLDSLETTVDAFEYLLEGRGDTRCGPTESDEDCIGRIEALFKEALGSDPKNAFAQLGLGLAQLRHAQILLPRASAATVGTLFMQGISNISSAKNESDYISHLMSTDEWTELVQQTSGLSDFAVTPTFIDSADAYREARRSFVYADFDATVEAIGKIRDLPIAIQPHVKNLELSARLLGTKDREEAEQLLEEFEKLPHSDTDGAWLATYAFGLCRWHNGEIERIEKALHLLDDSINAATDSLVTLLDRQAQKALCLGLVSRKDEAKRLLDTVSSKLSDASTSHKEAYRRVYYNLGVGSAISGDFARAAELLGTAVALEPAYLEGISRLHLLSDFRSWSGYVDWKARHLPKP